MRARAVGKPNHVFVAERLHLLWGKCRVHVSQAQTASTVGTKCIHLVILGYYKCLVSQVPKDAGKSDLGRELLVKEGEDCPAGEVHAGRTPQHPDQLSATPSIICQMI